MVSVSLTPTASPTARERALEEACRLTRAALQDPDEAASTYAAVRRLLDAAGPRMTVGELRRLLDQGMREAHRESREAG